MEIAQHPLWRVFTSLCELCDDLEAHPIPEALTTRLDGIIDHLCGLLLAQCHLERLAVQECPMCGQLLLEEDHHDTV